MNALERLLAEGMTTEQAWEKLGLRDLKQLDDLNAMRQASRLYRTERNPKNLWKRDREPILGEIRGISEGSNI